MSTAAPVNSVILVHGGFVDGSGWQAVYNILTRTSSSAIHTAAPSSPRPAWTARSRSRPATPSSCRSRPWSPTSSGRPQAAQDQAVRWPASAELTAARSLVSVLVNWAAER